MQITNEATKWVKKEAKSDPIYSGEKSGSLLMFSIGIEATIILGNGKGKKRGKGEGYREVEEKGRFSGDPPRRYMSARDSEKERRRRGN